MAHENELVAKERGKQVLKFALDCTHPTEDSIVDVAGSQQFHQRDSRREEKLEIWMEGL